MPDHYAKLTRAVVEIGTQLRRIADAHTTPVADDARCPTPETHNWGCGCPTDTSALRMELNAQRQRVEEAEVRAAVCREDAEHNATRAERAEQRAAAMERAMERAMESTAAAALKHSGCHAKLVAQCIRAEQAEEQRDQLAASITRVRTALNDRPPILNAEGGGINDYETGWRDHDRMVRAALDPPATEEQPDAR